MTPTRKSLQNFLLTSLVFVSFFTFLQPTLAQEKSFEQWIQEMQAINPAVEPSFEISEPRVAAAGIRRISGVHLDLYTDVRDPDKVDELTVAFDLAVGQWCEYFDVKPSDAKNWKLRAFLIADRNDPSRFVTAGLMPDDLPRFQAGYQNRHNLWFYLQPGDYYTRHLMIHEGTHAFMLWFLGGYGAPWYGEGMAEVFGVHQWEDNELTLRYRLRDRSEAPYWGRVKRIKDERETDKSMTLRDVLSIPPTAFLDVRYYAWSWAGCDFFAKHEKSKATFARLSEDARLGSQAFNRKFRGSLSEDWEELARDWELFIGEMEYGYQVSRAQITDAKPVIAEDGDQAENESKFLIQSDRGWQTTRINIKQGERLRVTGTGEFVVASRFADPGAQPWNCQSNGITINYYQGHPLGMLHAGILNLQAATAKEQVKGLLNPIPVGLTADFTAPDEGILCFRINESPSMLDDNQGGLEVTVEKLK